MTVPFVHRPAIVAALILGAAIAIAAAATPGSASHDQPGNPPRYPYATLSSVSR